MLGLTAVLEAATGLALVVYPSLVVWLLFGVGVSGAGMPISRIAGIALLSLGLACGQGHEAVGVNAPAFRGMFSYNLLAAIYFLYLGIDGEWVGKLLWPAVVVHAVITILFARAWQQQRPAS